MKKWLGFFGALLLSGVAVAQTTIVVGVVTDSDSTLWVNGTVSVQFVPNPSQPNLNVYRINNAPLSSAVIMQGPISLGSGGSFSITVYDNTRITPSGSQWQFTVCPNASSKCGSVTTSVSGSGQSITTLIDAAIPAPRFPAVAGNYGYVNVEGILSTPIGGTYWNVINSCQEYYSGSSWTCGSLPAPIIGPVLQCDQPLFTTGASDVGMSENNCNNYALSNAYLGYQTIDLRRLLAPGLTGSLTITSGPMHVGSTTNLPCTYYSQNCGITALLPQDGVIISNFKGGVVLSGSLYKYAHNVPTDSIGQGGGYNVGDLVESVESGYGFTGTANNGAIFEVTGTITGGGTSYAASTTYTTSTLGPGTGLQVQVTVSTGVITGVSSIIAGGTNYNNSDVVLVNGAGYNGLLYVTASGGVVSSAVVASGLVSSILTTPVNPITGSVTSGGPFTASETVTQTVSGATAKFVELGTGGTSPPLVVNNISGTPTATNVWTGNTSGTQFTPTALPITSSGYLSAGITPTVLYWPNGPATGTNVGVAVSADASVLSVMGQSIVKVDAINSGATTFQILTNCSGGVALDSAVTNNHGGGYTDIYGGIRVAPGCTTNTYSIAEFDLGGVDSDEFEKLESSGSYDTGLKYHGCCQSFVKNFHADNGSGQYGSVMLRVGDGDVFLNVCSTLGSNIIAVPYGNLTTYHLGLIFSSGLFPSNTIIKGIQDSRHVIASNVATKTTGGQSQCTSPTTSLTSTVASSGVDVTLADPASSGSTSTSIENAVLNDPPTGMPAAVISNLVSGFKLNGVYQEVYSNTDTQTPKVVNAGVGVNISNWFGSGSSPIVGNISTGSICVDNIFQGKSGFVDSPNGTFGGIATPFAPSVPNSGSTVSNFQNTLAHYCEGDIVNRSTDSNVAPDTNFLQGSTYYTSTYTGSSYVGGAGYRGSNAISLPLAGSGSPATGVIVAGPIPNYQVNVPSYVGWYVDASQAISGTLQYGVGSSSAGSFSGGFSTTINNGYKGWVWAFWQPSVAPATPYLVFRTTSSYGSGGIATVNYQSGLTVTGNQGDTIVLSAFNQGSGTTCTLTLLAAVSSASPAAGTPCVITVAGTGVSAVATSASTCTVGTASSCTGTATVTSMLPAIYISQPFLVFNTTQPAYTENNTGWGTAPNVGTAALQPVKNPVTSATGGTNTGTVTCVTAACTNISGSYSVVGGTFTTGTFLTLVWPTTTAVYRCWTSQSGGIATYGIGHSVATATGMVITAGITPAGVTVTIDYGCSIY